MKDISDDITHGRLEASDAVADGIGVPSATAPESAPVVLERRSRLRFSELLRAVRTRQWAKNALIFAGFIFAGRLREPSAVIQSELARVVLAFVCFCALSAAAYLINDWNDVERDRLHPKKKYRPLASGRMSTRTAAVLIAMALGIALLSSYAVVRLQPDAWGFGLAALFYFILTLGYSWRLKHEVIIDVLCVAAWFRGARGGGLSRHSRADFAVDHLLHLYARAVYRIVQAPRGAAGNGRRRVGHTARAAALYRAAARYFYCGGVRPHHHGLLAVHLQRTGLDGAQPIAARQTADDDIHSIRGVRRVSLSVFSAFLARRRRTRKHVARQAAHDQRRTVDAAGRHL
jgi:hypothetical protein